MAAHLEHTTETWRLDPPVVADRAYREGQYAIHIIIRTVPSAGDVIYNVKGVPLTKTGKPNGNIDWRTITDADMQRIIGMVPTSEKD